MTNTSADWAYFLGAFLGDGYASNKHLKEQVQISGIDLEILARSAGGIHYQFNGEFKPRLYRKILPSSKVFYSCIWYGKKLANIILNEISEKEYKDKIPNFIWLANNEIRKAFITGFFDTDGSVSVYQRSKIFVSASGSKLFFPQISQLLLFMGITNSLYIHKRGIYQLRISTRVLDKFDFYCYRKQNVLNRWKNTYRVF